MTPKPNVTQPRPRELSPKERALVQALVSAIIRELRAKTITNVEAA